MPREGQAGRRMKGGKSEWAWRKTTTRSGTPKHKILTVSNISAIENKCIVNVMRKDSAVIMMESGTAQADDIHNSCWPVLCALHSYATETTHIHEAAWINERKSSRRFRDTGFRWSNLTRCCDIFAVKVCVCVCFGPLGFISNNLVASPSPARHTGWVRLTGFKQFS